MLSDAQERTIAKALNDILKGYSLMPFQSRDVYIKHFSTIDNVNVNEIKDKKIIEAIKRGLSIEKDQAKILSADGLWTQANDDEVFQLKYYISNLQNTKSLLAIPSQIRAQEAIIEEENKKLFELLNKKDNLFGLTAEKWAERESSNYYIYFSLFQDKKMENPLFSWEEFENIDSDDLNNIILAYNDAMSVLNETNIKYASLSSTIQNFLSFSDNPYYLFGKPIISMTFFQSNIISHAKYYKFILENLNNLPEDVKTDPIKLENSFTASKNLNNSLNRGNGGQDKEMVGSEIVSVFGANEQDLKEMGLVGENEQRGQLHDELKRKGELDFADILKLPEFKN
jgi:hypothetical protein